jgi:hypothetical protein
MADAIMFGSVVRAEIMMALAMQAASGAHV